MLSKSQSQILVPNLINCHPNPHEIDLISSIFISSLQPHHCKVKITQHKKEHEILDADNNSHPS